MYEVGGIGERGRATGEEFCSRGDESELPTCH
jgi:hypothetical protein